MIYEYGELFFYGEHGYFYNYCVHSELREIKESLPNILQLLSSEGWQIVSVEHHEPHADNDYRTLARCQRSVLEKQ